MLQPQDLQPVASPARRAEYAAMEARANAVHRCGSTLASRNRFQLLEDALSTKCNRSARLPRAVRELTQQERRFGHLTARRPTWQKGDRVEIAREWRKAPDALFRDPEVLDPALDVVIRDVVEIRLGDLTWRHAEQLGHKTINALAVEWLDARDATWRLSTRTVETPLYDDAGEILVDDTGDWITETHEEPWVLENPSAAHIHAAWRRHTDTKAWLTRWTIVIPHETRQLPKATKQRAYVEAGGLLEEPEAVDADTLVRFVHIAAPGIQKATESEAAIAVEEVNSKRGVNFALGPHAMERRRQQQQERTERRMRRKAALDRRRDGAQR